LENSEIFATRLKGLRGKVPQGDLGKVLGVSRGSVSFYENEERTPDADFLIKASRHFDVSVDYLLGLSEHKNQKEIDGLLSKVHELDGIDINQKSSLLWSLGFVSERLKHVTDDSLKGDIVSLLAGLLQSYAGMIELPYPEHITEVKPGTVEMSKDTLVSLIKRHSQHHRDAINYLNQLDDVISFIAEEPYMPCIKNKGKGGADSAT
jgi:transcriptional regulator with XRE-family HTH domain